MEIIETAKMTSKGQITVPSSIRSIFNLQKGSRVLFKVTTRGVVFAPCEIKERESFTSAERDKIVRIAAERGKVYRSAAGARKHLEKL